MTFFEYRITISYGTAVMRFIANSN